jgi:xanthine dehydrogenase accessory factor
VTSTSGSTPQKPGSSAIIGRDGLLYGTVGGGVVEGKILKIAAKAINSGNSGYYHFNLANDISNKDEAICGGLISVLVDVNLKKNNLAFNLARQSLLRRAGGVMVTILSGSDENDVDIDRFWIDEEMNNSVPESLLKVIKPHAESLLRKTGATDYMELTLDTASGEKSSSMIFLEPVFPPPHLVIAGAGHIGKVMTHLGSMLGFDVTVIDDRPDLATRDKLPEASQILVTNIGEAMKSIKKDKNTYVLIVTRGHKDDAYALKHCIGSDLAYTGMIGSKKKVSTMRQDFIENGWASNEEWESIYAPVGLEIKSRTVEEIAVSIAAQLILVKNSKH